MRLAQVNDGNKQMMDIPVGWDRGEKIIVGFNPGPDLWFVEKVYPKSGDQICLYFDSKVECFIFLDRWFHDSRIDE